MRRIRTAILLTVMTFCGYMLSGSHAGLSAGVAFAAEEEDPAREEAAAVSDGEYLTEEAAGGTEEEIAAIEEGETANAEETGVLRDDLRFIFVHGLSGWGSYDSRYSFMPYWGMLGGDLMSYLCGAGYPSYAASVAPEGSAWDRACELYAQLAGTVVDYGKEHSERCGHERFGRDFSEEPLIPDWEEDVKLVLLGHSFGGVTVRLFSELLENGSAREQAVTDPEDLSGFFCGGQGSRIHAIVTLAAPTNGTTAYDMNSDPDFDPDSVSVSKSDERAGRIFASRHSEVEDAGQTAEEVNGGAEPDTDKAAYDIAAYDMYIDNALALNEQISTLPGPYYFAFSCSATEQQEDGNWVPVRSKMESLFRKTSTLMGCYTGVTAGGFKIDDSWKENDGLVNTVSSKAPIGAPSEDYVEGMALKPGIWYVMPVYDGDHMSLQGGMSKLNNVRPFYKELLEMICALP